MARFILDVGNVANTKKVMEDICDLLGNYIARIELVDSSMENQLWGYEGIEEGKTNKLTQEQIQNFNSKCDIV